MIIKLTNGNTLMPQGEIEIMPHGVEITGINSMTIIPHTQIRWIYRGQDHMNEKKVYDKIKGRAKANPILEVDRVSGDALMKGLWK